MWNSILANCLKYTSAFIILSSAIPAIQVHGKIREIGPESNIARQESGATYAFTKDFPRWQNVPLTENGRGNSPEEEPIHAKPAYKIDSELWNAFEKDLETSQLLKAGLRFPSKEGGTDFDFNQFTILMQLWTFLSSPLTNQNALNVSNARNEHLKAFIGSHDKYNICLRQDLNSAKAYFREMLEEYLIPALYQLDTEKQLIKENETKDADESSSISSIDSRAILERLCVDILQIDCPHVKNIKLSSEQFSDNLFGTIVQPLIKYDLFKSVIKLIVNGFVCQVYFVLNLSRYLQMD